MCLSSPVAPAGLHRCVSHPFRVVEHFLGMSFQSESVTGQLIQPSLLTYLLQDRNSFTLKLEDTENWLYEDGEDQPKQVYVDKLAELKVSVVESRLFEPH